MKSVAHVKQSGDTAAMRLGFSLACVWLGSACFPSVDFAGTDYQCPDGLSCPEGFVCHEQRCVETVPIDASVADATDDPLVKCGEPSLIADDLAVKPYWMSVSPGSGSLVFANGRATATTSAALGEMVEFGDPNHLGIADRRVFIEVLNVNSADVIFSFYQERAIELELSGGILTGRTNHGGETTLSSVAYNATLHRYWGLSARDGTIYMEVSEDAVTWTTVHSRQAVLTNDFGSINVAVGSVGSVDFDNLNGGTASATNVSCSFPTTTETFEFSQVQPPFLATEFQCPTTIGGGRLVWTSTDVAGEETFCGLETIHRHDLRNRSLGIEIPVIREMGANRFLLFSLEGLAGSASFFMFGEPTLQSGFCLTSGCTDLSGAPYDPAAHRFWRISHANAVLTWDVSADGTTWSTVASAPEPFDVGAVQLRLSFGADGPVQTTVELAQFGDMP